MRDTERPPVEHTAWVIKKIWEYIDSGKAKDYTYREFIYDVLGYNPPDYGTLQCADALEFNNWLGDVLDNKGDTK